MGPRSEPRLVGPEEEVLVLDGLTLVDHTQLNQGGLNGLL